MSTARTIGEAVFKVRPDLSGFGEETRRGVGPEVEGVGQDAGGKAAKGFGAKFGPMLKRLVVAAAGIAIFAGAKRLAEGSVEAFKELAGSVRSAQRVMGGTTEEVSGLRAAFASSGVDMKKFDTSMTILAKNLGKAQQGGTAAAKMTSLLGQGWQDAHGKALPISELLPKIADQFAAMPDGVQKTYAATQLFGRAGAAMLPALNKGSGGIAELTAKAKEMGLVLGDDSMEKFMASKKATREWNESLEGVKVTIGSQLLPIGTKLTEWLTSKAAPWMQRFVEQVKSGKGAGGEFADAARSMSDALQSVAQWLGTVLGWMGSHQTIVKGLALVLLTVVGAMKVLTIVTAAYNAVLDANPISLIVIALAALVVGLIYAYKHSETFRSVVQAMWGVVKGVFSAMVSGFRAVGAAGKWLWNNALQPTIQFILHGFAAVAALWAKVLMALSHVPGFGWARDAANAMQGAADRANGLADSIGKIHGKNVKLSVDDAQARGALNWLNTAMANYRSKSIDLVVNASLHVKQQNVPIPGRAAGGLVGAGHRYLVGEHGPELFTSSVAGRVTSNHALSRSSGGGGGAFVLAGPVILDIGGEQFHGMIRGVADDAIDDRNTFADFVDRSS